MRKGLVGRVRESPSDQVEGALQPVVADELESTRLEVLGFPGGTPSPGPSSSIEPGWSMLPTRQE